MPGVGAADRHHIRAVLDHFLCPSAPPAAACGAAPAHPGRPLRFAVAAAAHGFLAAWTAAGLARASADLAAAGGAGRMRVTLEEWHRQPWAAEPFLGGADRDRLRSLFRPAGFGDDARRERRWLGGVEVVPPALVRERRPGAASGGAVCAWINLGSLTGAALGALEAVRAWDGGAPLADGVDGLVWCLRADEAQALGPAYRLGRLAAALAPGRLKVAVFGDRSAPAGGTTDLRSRCTALSAGAVPRAGLELVVGLRDPRLGPAAPSEDFFPRLAGSLVLGAAASRRGPDPLRGREVSM